MKTFILALFGFLATALSAQTLIEKRLSNEIRFDISDGVRYDDGSWLFSALSYSITPGDSAMSIVLKTDSNFTPLWAKRLKYLRRDDLSCITKLKDGTVLVGGTMRQSFSLENGGSVFKMDTAGNVIWHLMYDEDVDDRVLDIFEQPDTTLMVFVREGVTNNPTKIIHANKNGAILTQRAYRWNTNQGLLANDVVMDENERYYMSGSTNNQGTQELFVCALTDTNRLWYRQYNFSGRNATSFKSAYVPADQSIVLGGGIPDTVGIFSNFWLVKMDLQGEVKWAKEFGNDQRYTENVSDIKPLPNGDLMVFGTFFDDNGSRGFAMKLDSLGNQLWLKAYNTVSPSFGIRNAFFLPDGRMLLNAGSREDCFLLTTTADGENACSKSQVSFDVATITVSDTSPPLDLSDPGAQLFVPALAEYDVMIDDSLFCATTVDISGELNLSLELYPNPVEDDLIVLMPGQLKQANVMLIDAVGKKYIPTIARGEDRLWIDVSNLSRGVYWVVLEENGRRYVGRFVRK